MTKFSFIKKYQSTENAPSTSTHQQSQHLNAISESSSLLSQPQQPQPKNHLDKLVGYFKDIGLDFLNFITFTDIISLGSGIIIGTLISDLVNSFVTDIISPPVGYLLGGANLEQLFLVIDPAHIDKQYNTVAEAIADGAVTLNFGNFIKSVIKFFLFSFVLFWLFKLIIFMNVKFNKLNNELKHKEENGDNGEEEDEGDYNFLLQTFRCPFCNTKTLKKCIRCPQCTSILDYKAFSEIEQKIKNAK